MITREQFISDLREKHPDIFSSTTPDEYIYQTGRKAFPDQDVEEWSEIQPITKPKADTSPDGWNELIFKDINDDSWEWVKHAYANSLQGTLEAWKNDELDYDIKKDYDELNVGEKILSGVASFLMPLDIVTLFGGGLASRGAMAIGKKMAGKQLTKSLAGRGFLTKLDALGVKRGLGEGVARGAIERAIVEGNTLGMYEAAKGGLAADNAGGDVTKGIADGYVHGSIMGAVFGGTGGVLEGNFLKYKALKELKGGFRGLGEKGGFAKPYTIPELEKMMKYTGAIPQYAAEVGALEAFTIVDAAKNGELGGEKLLEDLVVNIGFAGLMRGKRKLIGDLVKQYKKGKNTYEEDFHERRLKEIRGDERPWKERLEDQGFEGLKKVKEEAKRDGNTKLEEVVEEGMEQFNESRDPSRFKENEYLENLIKFDELDKNLIAMEALLGENIDAMTAKERVNILTQAEGRVQELLGSMDKFISDGHVTEVQGRDARAWLGQKASQHQDLIDRYFHKTTDTESRFAEKQQTARTLFQETQTKIASLAEKPTKEMLENLVLKEETMEAQIQTEKGADAYIRGTKRAISLLEGKEGAEGRDVSLKQSDYESSLSLLKDIQSGVDKVTTGSEIARKVLIGKDKAGTKYFEGVEDFSKVAFQDYTQKESSKQLKSYAPYVARFLRGTKNRPLDELTTIEVQSYIRDRVIENGGKPLSSTELSAISRFTKHISSGGGKFNKNIEWGINTESIFKATNKKLGEGTNPAVPGVRREAIEIGQRLSSEKGDAGYTLAADLMSKLGIRDQEVPNITKDVIGETIINGKKEYYLDMKARDFQVDPSSGRELLSIGVGKPNTARAYVYVPKQLAESLISYLENNKLQQKHYATVGKNITRSNNKGRKQLDLRSRMETLALQNHPELLPQLKYVLRHDKSRIDTAYQKMSPEQAIEMQMEMHKKLGLEGEAPKVKVEGEKPELGTPPQEPQRAVIDKIRDTKAIHERIKTRKDILEQYQPQNQKEILAQKDIIIDALEGAQPAKAGARVYLNRFIRGHEKAIQEIKANPTKKFPPLFGDIPWHETQIANYKEALSLLKAAPKQGMVEIGSFRESEGKGERRKLTSLIKSEQKYLGIERKQLGDKAYEREIRELTKHGLGYEDPVSSISNLQTTELYTFLNLIRSTNYTKSGAKFKAAEASVKALALERGVTEPELKQMLLELGVKDGEFENVLSKEVLNNIKGTLAEYQRPKTPATPSDHIVTFLTKGFTKFPSTFRRVFTPVYALLKNPKIGGEAGGKIADSFLNYDVTHSIKNGYATRRLIEIRGLLGDNAHMLQFFDKEKQRMWDKTPEEIAFIKRMETKGTDEYKALEIWDNLRKNLYNDIEVYAKQWSNKAIDEQLRAWMDRKYVEDYFTRRLSKEFLEILPELETQPFYEKMFNENMNLYVRGKVNAMKIRENETDLAFAERKKEKAENIKKNEDDINAVKNRVMSFLDMPNHKVINKNLMERGILLPRTVEIEIKGKRKTINSYDESFRGSAEYYGFSMSKYLATLRHFPEVTELGKELKLGNWKQNIFDILTSEKESKKFGVNRDWADYLRLTLETHLGMESATTSRINKKNLRWMGTLSSTGAAAGLSTPLVHGIKNLGLGFINSNRHFGMRNTFAGFLKYMDMQERAKMQEKGAGDYMGQNILRTQKNIFEEMGLDKKLPFGIGKWLTMDRIFDVNFMTKSEEIGRISSAFAGGLYFHQILGAYKGQKNSFLMSKANTKKQAEFAFKNQFKLSKEEIDFIKNTKYEDLFKDGENFNKMTWIQNKVEHFSHVSSQGGTSTILLPLWMSQPGFKPLTLFSRIATSATHDLWQNTFRPLWNHGNPMPLVRHAAASTFTGAGLYYFYKYIMGQDQMFEKSDAKWKTLAQYLWRAEFLGLWTSLINPHSSPIYGKGKTGTLGVDPTFVGDFFEPYMIRSARAVTEGLTTLMTDPSNPKAYSQAIKHITKNTVSGVGQLGRQWDRLIYPELHEWRGFRTAARSFKKEKGYEIPSAIMQSARSIYYRDLKDTFWKGSEKEFAKTYYNTLAYIDSDLLENGFVNPSFRRKEAMKRIEQSLKTLNPVNFSDESKGRVMSKKREFLAYLKNYDMAEYKRAIQAEKEFNFKFRKLLASVNKSKYKLDYSPYYDRY